MDCAQRKGHGNCCVVGCGNTYENTSKSVRFYAFPPDNYIGKERRQRWINAVKRLKKDGTPWMPAKHTRICSQHFAGGKKSEHPDHPAFIPTIFPTGSGSGNQPDDSRFKRLQERNKKICGQNEVNVNENATFEVENVVNEKKFACQTEFSTEENILYYNEVVQTNFFCSFLMERGENLVHSSTQTSIILKKCESKDNNPSCVSKNYDSTEQQSGSYFKDVESLTNDEHFLDLCGVKNSVFLHLLQLLVDKKVIKVSKQNKLAIFLMKAKTDLTFSALGVLFSLHRSTISRIFFYVLENLSFATKDYIYWPSKETIKSTLPKCFEVNYNTCRVIVDCTEFKVQQPAKFSDLINLYSHYKGNYTAKVLIGITPSGVVSFLSKVYGGKATDVQIMTECGLLDKFESGDTGLADKGFPGIKIQNDALIVLPPFLHDGSLTEEEVASCYNIASVRIHVERAIRRLKTFHILQNTIPTVLFPYLDDLVHVLSVLTNMMPPC